MKVLKKIGICLFGIAIVLSLVVIALHGYMSPSPTMSSDLNTRVTQLKTKKLKRGYYSKRDLLIAFDKMKIGMTTRQLLKVAKPNDVTDLTNDNFNGHYWYLLSDSSVGILITMKNGRINNKTLLINGNSEISRKNNQENYTNGKDVRVIKADPVKGYNYGHKTKMPKNWLLQHV